MTTVDGRSGYAHLVCINEQRGKQLNTQRKLREALQPHTVSATPPSSDISSISSELLSRSQSAETICVTKEAKQNLKNLNEIVAEGGLKALHAHTGSFVYEYTPAPLGTVLSDEEKAIRNKVLYTLVCEVMNENSVNVNLNERSREILVVRNTLSHVPPLRFVRLRKARKKVSDLKDARRTAKKRIAPIECIINSATPTAVNEVQKTLEQEKLFKLAPKKQSERLNALTASAAGAKISSLDPRTLAALEMQLGLSYRQSQFFRWFLKEAGCEKLFRGCNEKQVREEKMAAGNKFGYVVGTVVIFAKNDGSHSQKEVSCVSLDNFDVSLATSVAELDMANKYAAYGFH